MHTTVVSFKSRRNSGILLVGSSGGGGDGEVVPNEVGMKRGTFLLCHLLKQLSQVLTLWSLQGRKEKQRRDSKVPRRWVSRDLNALPE